LYQTGQLLKIEKYVFLLAVKIKLRRHLTLNQLIAEIWRVMFLHTISRNPWSSSSVDPWPYDLLTVVSSASDVHDDFRDDRILMQRSLSSLSSSSSSSPSSSYCYSVNGANVQGQIRLNGNVSVTQLDIRASNGYIHHVDGLLTPESLLPLLPRRCDVVATRTVRVGIIHVTASLYTRFSQPTLKCLIILTQSSASLSMAHPLGHVLISSFYIFLRL